MKTHKDLIVWQKAMDFVFEIYKLTSNFPSDEKFGLISQMRRSSVSIPSNIAEGAARNSTKDYVRFLYISLGSLSELETQIIIAHKLNYVEHSLEENIIEIRKMLITLIKTLKQRMVVMKEK
ncbi:four helix bundle protein [Lutibacter sp. HS1-25]|uniref:four helix bundle protein n=1 Tax=Lutibacter sp. HS1-25 TaxID=2485000 RepID=UPI0010130ACC|nr:four helix bundle protein [Lutibacter sp. HS1-25]RXP45909.1 four helix bundle protein [Lutibacter sp. HS1-25]